MLVMRLQRLTGLARETIEQAYQDLMKLIAELKAILADEEMVLEIIREELTEVKERFNDKRRTAITIGGMESIEYEALIQEQNIAIQLTHNGYIKR